ncbi:acyltransferase [Pseudarthrobacter sp. AL07]|uniref:acyltransferase family protein n=1 Tax=Pseudarthrobacter sp. AL07 TaxID=3042233 RepID=UPI00249BECF1|nr:acyltransferase [Pseudarthrobacter sp. AL07]MDI3207707.1 acyltransferase [Pseudarthrobacter sp. AL07]
MPTIRTQLNSLTGLRFFAAMAVVLYHLRIYVPQLSDGLAVFGYGFTGVTFFFILSGFVLAWSYRSDVRSGRFYWNRFARIWPLHMLTMIASIWIPLLSATSSATFSAVPFVVTLTQAWIPGSPFLTSFNGVSWSLSCEAFFYLLFPLLFRKLGSHRSVAWIAGGVLVALALVGLSLSSFASFSVADYLLGTMPLYRLGEFVLGMCLATVMNRGWRPRFRLVHAIGLSAISLVGLTTVSLIFMGTSGGLPVIYANLAMIPGFLAVISASASRDLSGSSGRLASSALVRLGQWSFALYLVHELVLRVVRPLIGEQPVGDALMAAVIVIFASIALSGLLHEFVEKPAEKWLRSLRGSKMKPSATPREVHHPGK